MRLSQTLSRLLGQDAANRFGKQNTPYELFGIACEIGAGVMPPTKPSHFAASFYSTKKTVPETASFVSLLQFVLDLNLARKGFIPR